MGLSLEKEALKSHSRNCSHCAAQSVAQCVAQCVALCMAQMYPSDSPKDNVRSGAFSCSTFFSRTPSSSPLSSEPPKHNVRSGALCSTEGVHVMLLLLCVYVVASLCIYHCWPASDEAASDLDTTSWHCWRRAPARCGPLTKSEKLEKAAVGIIRTAARHHGRSYSHPWAFR